MRTLLCREYMEGSPMLLGDPVIRIVHFLGVDEGSLLLWEIPTCFPTYACFDAEPMRRHPPRHVDKVGSWDILHFPVYWV